MKRALISGAGIAGPTLAYWLKRAGWKPVTKFVARRGLMDKIELPEY